MVIDSELLDSITCLHYPARIFNAPIGMEMNWKILCVIVGLALLPACHGGEAEVGDPVGLPFITDGQGRVLILHGVNVMSSSKSDPLRMPNITEADALRMARDWGFNFVRFLIFWDAAEPAPGDFDEHYFDRIEERLDWFHRAGIAVVLDMHQDVYAQRFCCDGAPDWAIRDDGLPFHQRDLWAMNYFEPAVQRAFDNFWNYEGPHSDLQDHYADTWAAVAARFRDHPAVIGYDLMNEPHPGSAVDVLELRSGRLGIPESRSDGKGAYQRPRADLPAADRGHPALLRIQPGDPPVPDRIRRPPRGEQAHRDLCSGEPVLS